LDHRFFSPHLGEKNRDEIVGPFLLTLILKQILTWWCTPEVPALRRLRQEDGELHGSMDYIQRTPSKKKEKSQSSRL
jgi:hypothetical protein